MKSICIIFLSLAITFSFAFKNEDFDESISLEDEAADALLESKPEAEKRSLEGCKQIGERCDKNIGDCNCCRSSGVCKCSWIDWTYCTCQVGSAAENWGTCLHKNKECNAGYDCGKRPCTRKGCKRH